MTIAEQLEQDFAAKGILTVGELIALLQALPQNAQVWCNDEYRIRRARIVRAQMGDGSEYVTVDLG